MQLFRLAAPCALLACLSAHLLAADATNRDLRSQAVATMRKAATFYHTEVASHGGYVYHYTLDLKTRWGEGLATETQFWIQPPASRNPNRRNGLPEGLLRDGRSILSRRRS